MKNTKILTTTCWTVLSACIALTPLEAAWGPINPLSDPGSQQIGVSIDNSCRSIACWQQSDDSPPTPEANGTTNVQFAELQFKGRWTAADNVVTLNNVPTYSAFSSCGIAADTGYEIATFFTEYDPTAEVGASQISTKEFGAGSWPTPETTLDPSVPNPVTLITPEGNAILALITSFTSDVSRTLPKGASFTAPIPIANAGFIATIGINANGYASVLYQALPDFDSPGPIFITTLQYGDNAWSSPIKIPGTDNAVNYSQWSTTDDAGNIVAVWLNTINGFDVVQSSTLLFGSNTWSPVLNVTPLNESYLINIFPAVNGITGDVVLLVTTTDGVIQSSNLKFGSSSWTPLINVSTPGVASSFSTSGNNLRIDACGNAIAVWRAVINGVRVVQSASLDYASNTWTTPEIISNENENVSYPTISMRDSGYAVVSWTNQDTTIVEATVWTPPTTVVYNVAADCSGDTVTINGNGFCGISSVQFDGVDAEFTVNSANSITATVPAGAAGTTVPVTISGGCTGGPIFGEFTYAPLPPSKFKGHIKKEKCEGRCIKKEKHHKHSSKKDSCKDQCVQQEPCKERCIKREKCEKCTLEAKWNASPSPDVVKYNIYKRGTLVATIPADSSLRFEKKLSKCRARGYTITAVAGSCQESVHVKLKLQD